MVNGWGAGGGGGRGEPWQDAGAGVKEAIAERGLDEPLALVTTFNQPQQANLCN